MEPGWFYGRCVRHADGSYRHPPYLHYCLSLAATLLLLLVSFNNTLPHYRAAGAPPFFARPDKAILKLGIIAFGCLVCEGTMFDWSGVYFQKVVAAPARYTTMGYVAFMGSMAAGRLIADWLVTKTGVKNLLKGSGLLIFTGLLIAVIFPNLVEATA